MQNSEPTRVIRYIVIVTIIIVFCAVVGHKNRVKQMNKATTKMPDAYSYNYDIPCKVTSPGKGTCLDHGKTYEFCNYNATEPCRAQ